ncbi:hypothetical protein GS490_25285 [Rhodococcus hoagii]|nr:hypothetical protein [Prescottella equi]
MIDLMCDETIVYFVSPDGVVLTCPAGRAPALKGSSSVKDLKASAMLKRQRSSTSRHARSARSTSTRTSTTANWIYRSTYSATRSRSSIGAGIGCARCYPGAGRAGLSSAPRWGCGGSQCAAAASNPPTDPIRQRTRVQRSMSCCTRIIRWPGRRTTPHLSGGTDRRHEGVRVDGPPPGAGGGGLAEVHVHRPGVLQLIYNGEAGATDLTFPELKTGETLMVDTEYGMQELEARDAKGARRNLWPLMKLARSPSPIPAGEVTIVRFSISKASAKTKLWGTVPQFQEGLL